MRAPNDDTSAQLPWPVPRLWAALTVGLLLCPTLQASECAISCGEATDPTNDSAQPSQSLELEGGSRDPALLAPASTASRRFDTKGSTPIAGGSTRGSRYQWTVGALDPDHDDQHIYRLPYGSGVSYPVLQGYGSRLSHQGAEFFTVDFQMPEGSPVHAARDGLVALIEESHTQGCWAERCGGLANYVVILHDDGTTGEYFHLKMNGVLVNTGERVLAGEVIAVSGNTGYITTPHLHFGVYSARARGRTQSIGVRFVTRGGVVRELRPGARHLNAD